MSATGGAASIEIARLRAGDAVWVADRRATFVYANQTGGAVVRYEDEDVNRVVASRKLRVPSAPNF
jgi:hypothetical protein